MKKEEQMSYTPGPWRCGSHSITSDTETILLSKNMMRIEDAHLIAAAPDLLEALCSLERQALQSDVNSLSNEWGQEALAMARAAIVKATEPILCQAQGRKIKV